jgi:hypothetical protein
MTKTDNMFKREAFGEEQNLVRYEYGNKRPSVITHHLYDFDPKEIGQ